MEALQAGTAKTEKEAEWQKKLVWEAKKVKKVTLNVVASLRERVAVANTREGEILSNTSVSSDQVAGATAELCQARHTFSTQSKEFVKVVVALKSFKKGLEDDVIVLESSEEKQKNELAATIHNGTLTSQLVDDLHVERVDV